MNTTTCRACGGKIMFAKTKAGKAMPLDAAKTTVWVTYQEDGDLHTRPVGGHVPHWATCSDTGRFRK